MQKVGPALGASESTGPSCSSQHQLPILSASAWETLESAGPPEEPRVPKGFPPPRSAFPERPSGCEGKTCSLPSGVRPGLDSVAASDHVVSAGSPPVWWPGPGSAQYDFPVRPRLVACPAPGGCPYPKPALCGQGFVGLLSGSDPASSS